MEIGSYFGTRGHKTEVSVEAEVQCLSDAYSTFGLSAQQQSPEPDICHWQGCHDIVTLGYLQSCCCIAPLSA